MKRITSALAVMIVAATAVAMAEQTKGGPAPDASVQWQKHKQSEGNAPSLEFQTGTATDLNCEPQPDAYEPQLANNAGAHCAGALGSSLGHSKGSGRLRAPTPRAQHTFRPGDFRFALPTDTPDDGNTEDGDDSSGGKPH